MDKDQFEKDRQRLMGMQVDNEPEDLYADFTDDDDKAKGVYEDEKEEYDESRPAIKRTADEDEVDSFGEIHEKPPMDYYDEYEDYTVGDSDFELFPNGPLNSEVQSWKKQFENNGHRVVIAEVDGSVYIFRTLNRFEYKQIVAIPNSNPITREEIFCKTCILWPVTTYESMTEGRGGVPSTLSQVIMEHSGFVKNWEAKIL